MNERAIIKTDDGIDIDVEQLEPGDYIEPISIEAVFGVSRTNPRYGLCQLSLAKLIERKSSSNGSPLQCKGEGYGVRILTASEQVEYNWEGFWAGARKMDKAEEWMKKVNASGLPTEIAQLKIDRQQKMAGINQARRSKTKKLCLSFSGEPEQLKDGKEEF